MTDIYAQTEKEYAEYCERFGGDLIITLNAQHDKPTYESLSKMISKLFYKLECDEFGYEKRERYKKVCRIERIVAIEQANKTHAHVIVKRFGNKSDDTILASIVAIWYELNDSAIDMLNSYLVSLDDIAIRNNKAVSGYVTKDVAKQLKQGKDVIDFRSSFICKHSNKQ